MDRSYMSENNFKWKKKKKYPQKIVKLRHDR